MIKRIVQKIKNKKIGKNTIIFYLPDEKKSRLRAFARTRAKKIKVSKSQKQIMVSLILPKNIRNSLRILSWVCFIRCIKESKAS